MILTTESDYYRYLKVSGAGALPAGGSDVLAVEERAMLKAVGATRRRGYRRIVWPTDFSPSSRTALRHLLQVTDDRGEVIVVHLLAPTLVHTRPGTSLAGGSKLDGERRDSARDHLRRVMGEIESERPDVRVRGLLVRAAASHSIARIAERLDADLIVLTVRGRSARDILRRATAEKVLRGASCPVLTVPVTEG